MLDMMKRVFDITASFFGLVLVSPVLGVIALIIKSAMGNPIIYCQKRSGRHGNLFTIYKFRSMTSNHDGSTVSIKGESRITTIGAFLRKYKLDELPELWNVLKGDMSFVGPRPDVPEYLNKLVGEERLILELRPGITSPASLKYTLEEELVASAQDPLKYYNEVIWPDKVRLNLEYYRNRSFFGDLMLILRTVFVRRDIRSK
jgi:lipopolysaccharide/colanic/teichoic acid biosynthesis glycosyltransferase